MKMDKLAHCPVFWNGKSTERINQRIEDFSRIVSRNRDVIRWQLLNKWDIQKFVSAAYPYTPHTTPLHKLIEGEKAQNCANSRKNYGGAVFRCKGCDCFWGNGEYSSLTWQSKDHTSVAILLKRLCKLDIKFCLFSLETWIWHDYTSIRFGLLKGVHLRIHFESEESVKSCADS